MFLFTLLVGANISEVDRNNKPNNPATQVGYEVENNKDNRYNYTYKPPYGSSAHVMVFGYNQTSTTYSFYTLT